MNAPAPRDAATRTAFAIPSLDGLRAVSFLLVFFGHAGWHFIPAGFGVTVFFFLSGYLITTLLRLEVAQKGRINFRNFYLRRALRIWPPFYLVLGVAFVLNLAGVLEGDLAPANVAAQVLHYSNYWIIGHGWGGVTPGTGVLWSLAVEEHFYLLFPALYAFLVRSKFSAKRQAQMLLGICAVTLAWRFVLVVVFDALAHGVDRTFVATDTRLDSMLFGCILAVHNNPAIDLPERETPRAVDLAFLGAGLGALLASFLVRNDFFRETSRYTLQGFGLYPVFVCAVRFPRFGPFRLLNLRPVKFLGTLSYSLYLVHHIVILAVDRAFGGPGPHVATVGLAVSIAVAAAIWYFVEEPCATLRRRLSIVSAAHAGEREAPSPT